MSQKNNDFQLRSRPVWLVVFGAIVAVALPAAIAMGISVSYYPLTSQRIDLRKGELVFRRQCRSCHSTVEGAPAQMGPNLVSIGRDAQRRREAMSATDYILESILDPGAYRDPNIAGVMPQQIASELSPTQIRNVVAYLSSRNAEPNYRELLALKIKKPKVKRSEHESVELAKLDAGQALFMGKGKCITCHTLVSYPGHDLVAPGILTAGRHAEEYLRQSLVQPNEVITPGYEQSTIVLSDGRLLTGRITDHRADRLTLVGMDDDGNVKPHIISLDDVDEAEDGQPDIVTSPVSLMIMMWKRSMLATN